MGRKAKVVEKEADDYEYEYEEEVPQPKKRGKKAKKKVVEEYEEEETIPQPKKRGKKPKKKIIVEEEEEPEEEEEEEEGDPEEEEEEEDEEEYEEDYDEDDSSKKKKTKGNKKSEIDIDSFDIPEFMPKESCVVYTAISKIAQVKGTFDNLKDALVRIPIKFSRPEKGFVPTEKKPHSGGIVINACDGASNSVIKQRIYSSAFIEFYVDPDICDRDGQPTSEYNICVDAKQFTSFIKQISNTDVLIWYIDKNALESMTFIFYNHKKKSHHSRTLKLKNLDPAPPRVHAPTIECKITMYTADFQKYIKDSSHTTEDIKISFIDTVATPNTVRLSDPEGTAAFNANQETEGFSIEKIRSTEEGTIIENTYRLKLLAMFKTQSHCKYVDIIINNNHPLIITYTVENFGYTMLIINIKKNPKDTIIEDEEEYPISAKDKKAFKKSEMAVKKNTNRVVEEEEDEEEEEEEEEEDEY